jgi:hypothetical protein
MSEYNNQPKLKRCKTTNSQFNHQQQNHNQDQFNITNEIIYTRLNEIDSKINYLGATITILCNKIDSKFISYEQEIIKLGKNINISNNNNTNFFINLDKKMDLINHNLLLLNEKNNINIQKETEMPQEMLNAYG